NQVGIKAVLMNVKLSQTKIRILIMRIKRVLKTDAFPRCIGKNISDFGRSIEFFSQDFRTPKISGELVSVFVKMNTSRLFIIVHVSEIKETYPTFFQVGILPTIHHIDLFPDRIIQKMVVIHIVFFSSCISVSKQR